MVEEQDKPATPKDGAEAVALLMAGRTVELPTKQVMDFLRWMVARDVAIELEIKGGRCVSHLKKSSI